MEEPCPMWKMFYNPINEIFNDLENNIDVLENLITTFLTYGSSFTNTFVPKFDSNVPQNRQEVEETYFAFTLWFQGSLFYLIGCPQLHAIHDLSVKAQCQLFHIILHQPHFHQKLVIEYIEALETIEKYHLYSQEEIIIKQFLKQQIQIEDINLKPEYLTVDINNINTLTDNLLQIIKYILIRKFDLSISNNNTQKVWNILTNLFQLRNTTKLQLGLLESMYLILKDLNEVGPYLKFLSLLTEQLELNPNLSNSCIVKKIFKFLNHNLHEDVEMIRFYFQLGKFDTRLFQSCVLKFPHFVPKYENSVALEIQRVLNFDKTFDLNLIPGIENLHVLHNFFINLFEVLKSAGLIFNRDISNVKLFDQKLIEQTISNLNSTCDVTLINIIYYILILTEFPDNYRTSMFSTKLWKFLTPPDVPLEIICSVSIQCAKYDSEFILLLNNFLKSTNKSTVIPYLPYLISSNVLSLHTIVGCWLLPSVKSQDSNLAVSQSVRLLLCIASNQYQLINEIVDGKVTNRIICKLCDKIDNRYYIHGKLREVDNSFFGEKKNVNFDNLLTPFWKLLESNDLEVKKNMMKLMVTASYHFPKIITMNLVKTWVGLLEHDDFDVRNDFNKYFGTILENIQDCSEVTETMKESIISECISGLLRIRHSSLQKIDKPFQLTASEAFKIFGCHLSIQNAPLYALKYLIYYALSARSVVQEFACFYIQKIAESQKITPAKLYIDYKRDVCATIVDLTILNYLLYKILIGNSCSVHRLIQTFGFVSTNDFLSQEGRYLVPYLVPYIIQYPCLEALLDSMADSVLVNSAELLVNHFGTIYPNVYLNETDAVYCKVMVFITKLTKLDEATLKRKHVRVIFNELVLYYHKNQTRALDGLKVLLQDDVEVSGTNQVIKAIQSRFLGLLMSFDGKLNSTRVCISDKRHALKSLAEIIKLMGAQNITPLRFKIIATLNSTLTNMTTKELQMLCCLAWKEFVQNCDIETMGTLLSTIFISLLPCTKLFPELIQEIFHYFAVRHEEALSEYWTDLFFISDIPEASLLSGTQVMTNILGKLDVITNLNFKEKLQFYMKYLQHENNELRIHALNFITKLLEVNREGLNELILGNNGLDPVIGDLVDLLIKGFLEKDQRLHLACSTCIGELGAIEPSHLPKIYAKKNETFTFTKDEDNFAIMALNELIRALQSEKHSQNMDCFALAIQEILKIYHVTPRPSSRKTIWESFPENQQEIMQPLLTSRYKVALQTERTTKHPLYLTSENFTSWIHNWIAKLILTISNEDTRYLFQCCQPSIRRDSQVLTFFLPYILIHALFDASTGNTQEIYEEMFTVLQAQRCTDPASTGTLQFKPLKSDLLRYMPSLPTTDEIRLVQSSKMVYLLLDFLMQWLRTWEKQNCPEKMPESDVKYMKISGFVKKFSKLCIAKSNYNCEEFPRALMYLEDYVYEFPDELESQFSFLTRIYVQMEDPDSVAGVQVIQKREPPLEDRILSHEISGQVQDAVTCYEQLVQDAESQPQIVQGLIRLYLDLNYPFTDYRQSIERLPSFNTNPELFTSYLLESQVESLWRFQKYDKLENLLENPDIKKMSSWGCDLGNILLSFHKGEQEVFNNEINRTRCALVLPLSVSHREEGSYEYGYPQVMKLHILNEFQKVEQVVSKIQNSQDLNACTLLLDNLIAEFDKREMIVHSSVRVLEPMYCLRRVALDQAQNMLRNHPVRDVFNTHIGNYWLKSAQVARLNGMYQQAYTCLLNAEKFNAIGLFVERGRLHWSRGEQEKAFTILKRGLDSQTTSTNSKPSLRKINAEAKLLVALYNQETANLEVEANIAKYKEAIECNKESESSMVYLAQYYDKSLTNMSGNKDVGLGADMQLHMINNFGKSLEHGKEFLYQSMPRMLSVWLDFGSRQVENRDKETHELRALSVNRMTKLISSFLDRLPAYMFLSAFSQIVSRICHPQRQVYHQLKTIIVTLIKSYPQQSLWMIMSVFKSSYSVRMKRCQEILQDERLKTVDGLPTLIHDFNRLAEKLIELCNKPISNGIQTTTVSTLIKSLPRLISNKGFSQILVPVEKYLKMVLPINNELLSEHNPFPNKFVYIAGIEETVTVMPSLQRPRRITLIGSDGKHYMHMLKPKDDLRKDFRLMEFNGVVNQYLHHDSESRQRRLHIRTYAVVPLNEECGIIEWVPNLLPFRSIILTLHKQKKMHVPNRELRTMICNIRDSLEKKRQVYKEQLLVRHPLVFHEWFRQTFPDPYAWYHARTSYIRTTATISIVGYILGLGDRHGENILFDATNGDTVHVDFNCLFNRGLTLEWPERVPFRLTPNMVKAMGPLGVEGTFRRSCEVTLRVLRAHTDTLMSILKPFVYDPLVSWPKNPHAANLDANAERTNEQARDHVRNIESRLQGIKGGGKLSICLSVEGHVNSLILDATNVDNLCQMYIGWGAYL